MKNQQLNILFFTGSIAWGGGTERSVSLISSYLVNKGFDVKILSVFDGKHTFYNTDPKVGLLSLNMQGKSPTLQYINTVYILRKLLISHNIDVIVITDVILSLYVFPAIIGIGIKTILRENFHYFANLNSKKRKISRLIAVRFADTIITISNKDKKNYEMKRADRDSVVAIHNVKPFKSNETSNTESNIVLAVGNLRKVKGYDLLLKTWQLILKKREDWKLQIVGGGVEENNLKELAKKLNINDSVEFVGQTLNVKKYYKNASIYVMSSRFEGFGFVLVEAKEFGLPIVSFDCPYGPAEVVKDGIDGLLAKPENIDDLSEKLLILMQDRELRKQYGQNALEDDRFEQETVLPKWEKVINGLFA